MLKLPCPLKLVEVFGAEIIQILLQHAQKLDSAGKQRFVGRIVRTDAANIFVHDLLETLKSMNRQQIAWRDSPCRDFVASDFVGFEGLVDRLLEFFVLRFTDLRLFLT